MKYTWLVGTLAGVLLAGSAAAQTQPQTPSQSKPTTQAPAAERQPPATTGAERNTTMRQRGTTGATAAVPSGQANLGTVSIPRPVMADGKPLPRGQYTVRLTAQSAQPTVPGQLPDLNRWVEFVQGGTVKGREVVSIIPADEVKDTQPGPDMPGHVGRNGSRVEMLKGGEYLRVWINRGGNNYLVHLPPAGAATR
jgi:hypothetical protein